MSVAVVIATQRARYGIPHATACRALGVGQAWFYKWRHGDRSPRHARREQLTAKIKQLFAAHRGRYGSPRITADLVEERASELGAAETVVYFMEGPGAWIYEDRQPSPEWSPDEAQT